MIKKLDNLSRRFSNWLAVLGLFALVILASLTIANVFARWLFSSPLGWVEDIYRLLIAVVVASFFPSAFAHRGHMAIEFLNHILSPSIRKVLAILVSLIVFVFTIILGWQILLYAMEVWDAGETTWLHGFSVTPWWVLVSALLLTTIPIQLIVVMSTLYYGVESNNHGISKEEPELRNSQDKP